MKDGETISGKIKEKAIEDLGYDELLRLVEHFEAPAFTELVVPLLAKREDRHIRTLISGPDKASEDKARGGIAEIGWLLSIHDVAMSLAKELREAQEAKENKGKPRLSLT